MTEDDTFLVLKRRPLLEVFIEFRHGHAGHGGARYVHELMVINGWTLKDYYNIYYDELLAPSTNKLGLAEKDEWVGLHMDDALTVLRKAYGNDFNF